MTGRSKPSKTVREKLIDIDSETDIETIAKSIVNKIVASSKKRLFDECKEEMVLV